MQEKKALISRRRRRLVGFLDCRASAGFLTRYERELREPLVWRQGSQVSMRVARGSASWLSSHGRGLGPRDALKEDSRGLSRGAEGNPRFPRLLPGIGPIWMCCLLSVNQDGSHVLMCRNGWKILEKESDKRKPALPDLIMHSKLSK